MQTRFFFFFFTFLLSLQSVILYLNRRQFSRSPLNTSKTVEVLLDSGLGCKDNTSTFYSSTKDIYTDNRFVVFSLQYLLRRDILTEYFITKVVVYKSHIWQTFWKYLRTERWRCLPFEAFIIIVFIFIIITFLSHVYSIRLITIYERTENILYDVNYLYNPFHYN